MIYNYRQSQRVLVALVALVVSLIPLASWSFDSGSNGNDGVFSPTVDTVLDLPADGILNFTAVTIPTGITVTFNRNTANTSVTLLVSGDVIIDGTIDVSGGDSTAVGAADDGNPGDDSLYGMGGPGGFNGGRGGVPGSIIGSAGLGPGGGNQARGVNTVGNTAGTGCGGGGAGYLSAGKASQADATAGDGVCDRDSEQAMGGDIYGSEALFPLIGGSGGGGGSAGSAFAGSGGGGGGGAILIASSGTVTINGEINANGGNSGKAAGSLTGGTGGGGSGGAIRIIATVIDGNGAITALGGSAGAYTPNDSSSQGGNGSNGRIRLEADTYKRTASTSPAFSFDAPKSVFIDGLPSLRISSVAGIAAPASPTGKGDIILPQSTPNPIVIEFATTGVPAGNTVELRITPASGPVISASSAAIAGTNDAGSASVSVNLPDGPSVLSAQVNFPVSAAMSEKTDLSRFAQGESVESIRLTASPSKGSLTTLITATGKEYTWPTNALVIN